MKRNNVPEAVGIFISLCGIAVMIGWFLNIGILKSILPVWVSMKFSTALSFFLCGVILYFVARFQKKDRDLATIIIPIVSMAIFLLMVSLLASSVLEISSGVEELFVRESIGAVKSVAPGVPSIATMINFIVIAMGGVLTTMNVGRPGKIPTISGATVAIIGSIAVLGYSVNQPLLYYAVQGKSTAMALHTAILFVLCGVGLIAAKKK